MAPTSVSEENQGTREEMAHASAELGANMRALAVRLAWQPSLADRLNATASFFDRFERMAKGPVEIHEVTLRTLARIYQDIAIKVSEAAELVHDLDATPRRIVLEHVTLKVTKIADLTCIAIPLVL